MATKKLNRPPLTDTIEAGHFGHVGKGWPYEGMFDENDGVTSSVFGQDIYRLNEGPLDLVHRTSADSPQDEARKLGMSICTTTTLSQDDCLGDLADQWIKKQPSNS